MLRRLVLALPLLATLSSAADDAPLIKTGGRKRAVVVGAECMDNQGKRSSASVAMREKNVRSFAALLESRFGFKKQDIVVLTNAQATTDAIVGAINRHLIAQSQPGDVAVFMFTGHGSQVADFDGDEEDGLDEVICPWDHDWRRVESWFTDDILGNLLDRISHANVMIVVDSCHAGTMTRGVEPDGEFQTMGLDSGFLTKPAPPSGGGGGNYIRKPPPRPWEPPPVPFDLTEAGQKFRKAFPDPDRRVVSPPQQGGGASLRPAPAQPGTGSRFSPEETRRLREIQREIREIRQTRPPEMRQIGFDKGWELLDALVETRFQPPQQQRLRQEVQKLPESDAVLRSIDKVFRPRLEAPMDETDWKVLKGAEEFMRQKNTFLPETVEALELFSTMTKAALHKHPLLNPPGSQVVLAATTSDSLSWSNTKTGSFFLGALARKAALLDDSTTFEQWVEALKPEIHGQSREAATKNTPDGMSADDPNLVQKPYVEGAGGARVLGFMRGFQAEFRPVSEAQPVPLPEPLIASTWQKQSGDITLHLSTDKAIYTEGDLMSITLTPDHDCHIRLYYLSAEHQVHQIFPNQFQTDGFVKKDQTVTLPGAGGAFDFRMGAPFGNEILMAVASSVPFTDQAGEDLKAQLFQEFKDTNLEALAHRGIEVAGKEVLTGRALHLYRVEARK